MKCTNKFLKIKLLCLLGLAAVFMSGCGFASKTVALENEYHVYNSSLNQFYTSTNTLSYFAENLCVSDDINIGLESTHSEVAQGAGVFNLSTGEIPYRQNIYERLYPASTTKILTAYIIISECNLDDVVTVSQEAINQTTDSSVCGLSAGDVLTVRDLLYGLMLASGNDAAVALAEYHSGSVEQFALKMNSVARRLGATDSNFVNPNGLPDENHYTTVYDMYLIMANALSSDDFKNIIHTQQYDCEFKSSEGETRTKTWNNTNQYLTGAQNVPEGFTIIGGKTGTTNAAGYCLVLCSQNAKGEDIVSIVFKADGRSNLYLLMSEILSGFAN